MRKACDAYRISSKGAFNQPTVFSYSFPLLFLLDLAMGGAVSIWHAEASFRPLHHDTQLCIVGRGAATNRSRR